MKAVLCEQFCTPDELKIVDIAEPVAEAGHAVVGIKAVGLNFFDILQIGGKYQIKPPFPFSPGAEISGVVESVGPGVTAFKAGDRVMGSIGFNGARERVAVPVDALIKIPDALEFDRAAAMAIIYGTTYYALKDRSSMKPGESLAVLGAAGGVGLAAVELGKIMGAHVIACASSDEKLAFAKKHGADATINYATENLRDALRERTGGQGVDVVYDPVGGAYTEAAVRALNWEGRLLVIGFAAGDIPKLPLNLTLLKNCDIRGVFWGAWTRRDPKAHAAAMAQLVQWAAEKKISAHVHAHYRLDQTAQALADIAGRKVMGKAVLTI
jgi:NADPH2:quinone reductase